MAILTRGNDVLARHPDFQLVGRDAELRRLIGIMIRSRSNSVILSGAGGSGSSAMCYGIQAMKKDADVPFDVVSKRLFWIDVNELFSSGDPEGIKAAFKKVLDTLRRMPESVLILEDTRSFMDGCNRNGCSNLINALLSSIRNKETQAILEVKDEDLEAVLKAHHDMRELFTIMPVEEVTGPALRAILDRIALQLTAAHGIRIDADAIGAAIEVTSKYKTKDSGLNRAQPEKTITLLDRAMSPLRLEAHQSPAGMAADEWAAMQERLKKLYGLQRAGEVQMMELEDELENQKVAEATRLKASEAAEGHAVRPSFNDPFANGSIDTGPAAEINRRIVRLKAGIEDNGQAFAALTERVNAHLSLSRDDVLREFSRISGIDVSRLGEDDKVRLKMLEPALSARIFGQPEAVRRVADAIKVARIGGRHGQRPQAAFLMMGASGTGKTEIAKALSAHMLGDAGALTRYDMSEFAEKHSVARLIGAPPGYEGFEAGGMLTNAMRRNGNRIILFDEIEKGHPDVYDIFLQILSDGRLTDNVGRVVSFDQSIIVMTTNLGQHHFLDPSLTWEEASARALEDLSSTYRAEFLNRFAGRQNIIPFRLLGMDTMKRIVAREVDDLTATYGAKGFPVIVGDQALSDFCEAVYDPKIGSRGLPGYIEANLEPIIVRAVLESEPGILVVTFDKASGLFAVTPGEQAQAA